VKKVIDPWAVDPQVLSSIRVNKTLRTRAQPIEHRIKSVIALHSPVEPGLSPPHGDFPLLEPLESQTYRISSIIAGILIPLSVLRSIPSLTSSLHVQTDGNVLPSNPLFQIVAMCLSVACSVLANIHIILRFAERSIKMMALLCNIIILLSMNGWCFSCAFIFFC
jgi:hypothetical protein